MSDRHLRRAALDYADGAALVEHDSYGHFDAWRRAAGRRLLLLTTSGTRSAYDFGFEAGDILLAGRETAGVPAQVASAADERLRIPMRPGRRSINVALAAGLVLGEALRQTGGFGDLQ